MDSESRAKPRKSRASLSGFFRGRDRSSAPSIAAQLTAQHQSSDDSLDRQREKARYFQAVETLHDAVEKCGSLWKSFNFAELDGELEDVTDSQFKNKIDTALEVCKDKVKDRSALKKCGHALKCCFMAFSPFAKNVLTIAKEGSAVSPH
jgi:hypothetical protein